MDGLFLYNSVDDYKLTLNSKTKFELVKEFIDDGYNNNENCVLIHEDKF